MSRNSKCKSTQHSSNDLPEVSKEPGKYQLQRDLEDHKTSCEEGKPADLNVDQVSEENGV